MSNLFKNYIYPIATLSGSIIGVGFLSLPYITLKVGIWPMLFYFVALTALVVYIHVIFGKISLKTPDFKRFPGFVGFYLGRWAEAVTLISIIFGSFGLFLIYFIVGGQFLTTILHPFLGSSASLFVVLYFVVASMLVYSGVKIISKIEFWALVLLLVTFFVIYIGAFSHIKLENIFVSNNSFFSDIKTMFLPYGAIIFSLWGIGLIPEIEEMLIGRKSLLKRIIIISILVSAATYFLFIFLILGISGIHTTESAFLGLEKFLGQGVFSLVILIGLITIFNSFITQGLFLKKTFMYDMNMKEFPAWALTCLVPPIFFLLGINSFISLISLIGGLILGVNGILILLMYRKIGGKKLIVYPLMVVFFLGIIYSIMYSMK
ncbi:MAG: hypothetical protein A2639_01470 [Candidatus Staskawiczbacteria bacterium RIFCSPHIGHO2_01_FULL_34_27]|uniref:Amino acid transporter transmembrane domain-containing protein n=1 Tax=Candidatus Staskawiczbacteria bacterium RIFCSPHIGHO2_01_FULL_34_27 TaxID=1802199 RepID=A0A1G2HKX8_9BACT|nr:MAG: hypothetical protein A2639_01470 [Candidatus Staskawiczbacteria bacterium RIFCSPHIGHO2_01_FULL_34_27]